MDATHTAVPAPATPRIDVQDVAADLSTAHVDGVEATIDYEASTTTRRRVTAVWGASFGEPLLAEPATWAANQPDLAPTAENMRAVLEAAADRVAECVLDYADECYADRMGD
jgi:hypothetical protein